MLFDRISPCTDEVLSWMRASRLQANPSKIEVLWCSSSRHQHQIPTMSVRIGTTDVLPVSSVRDLGVYIDSDVTVISTVRSCFSTLRQLRSMRRCLPKHALLTLIRALVVSKVDYCCLVLAGVSGYLLDRLQSVLNAATRLMYSARRSEHVTLLLQDLHLLRVPEQIPFRLCVLTYYCLNGTAPSYLTESIRWLANIEGQRHLCSLATTLIVLPTRLSTLGDQAFPVVAPRAWNSLPSAVRATTSLIIFRWGLEAFLYHLGFVDY